jgi:hypothetical protein
MEETGEYDEQELNHSDGEAERFYKKLKERGVGVRCGAGVSGQPLQSASMLVLMKQTVRPQLKGKVASHHQLVNPK